MHRPFFRITTNSRPLPLGQKRYQRNKFRRPINLANPQTDPVFSVCYKRLSSNRASYPSQTALQTAKLRKTAMAAWAIGTNNRLMANAMPPFGGGIARQTPTQLRLK